MASVVYSGAAGVSSVDGRRPAARRAAGRRGSSRVSAAAASATTALTAMASSMIDTLQLTVTSGAAARGQERQG